MSAWSGGGGSFDRAAWDGSATRIACDRLRLAADRARSASRMLRFAPELRVTGLDPAARGALARCRAELDDRADAARALADDLDALAELTAIAGRLYESASTAVQRAIEELAGTIAYGLGHAARGAVIGALMGAPIVAAVGIPAVLGLALVGVPIAMRVLAADPQRLEAIVAAADRAGVPLDRLVHGARTVWAQGGEALAQVPGFTSAMALAVESSDEALAGFLGVPAPVAAGLERELGDDVLLGGAAAVAAVGARLGLGAAGGEPIGRVQAGIRRPVAPPDRPVADPAEAVRILSEQREQVTIHEYAMPDGTSRFQVFVRGTEDWSMQGPSGLDVLANVENAAVDAVGMQGADAAVAEAMRRAGIEPGDRVDLFAHSQGGAAALNVAESGAFDVDSVLVVGAPVDDAEVPAHVAVLAVQHDGDPVPALGGIGDGPPVPTVRVESASQTGTGFGARHGADEYLVTAEALAEQDFGAEAWVDRLERETAGGEAVRGWEVQLRRR